MKPLLIVITGPTASGKSALAALLAKRLSTEVISADSRQIYQGIPICTAVPSAEERLGVRHHLLETLPLDAYYSASMFEEEALSLAQKIMEERETVVVCGGSMMYVDALCNGMDNLPTVAETIRMELTNEWKDHGDTWLLSELKAVDPAYYEKADLRNMKRVFHAIEVSRQAGRPYSSLLTGERTPRPFRIVKFLLDGERELLFERINRRAEGMIKAGLEEEARAVFHLRHLNSLNTVGMKEMFSYFDGEMTLPEAVARMQKNTRVYAKKQLTWNRRDKEMTPLDFSIPAEVNCEKILGLISQKS